MSSVPSVDFISVQRISQLPIVESSVNIVNVFYRKLKTLNPIVNWTLDVTEVTILKAAKKATPLMNQLQGPIKRVDSLICVSLDYVENKVPAVKLPPQELFGTIVYFFNDNVISYFQGNGTNFDNKSTEDEFDLQPEFDNCNQMIL